MPRRLTVVLSEEELQADAALAVWLTAARFRRTVERALRKRGLTFSQWRVLYATRRLVAETDEQVVSQLAVAQRLEMDQSTISSVMRDLMGRGLISWGLDAWGWSYRLFVTDTGRTLLEASLLDVLQAARVTLRDGGG